MNYTTNVLDVFNATAASLKNSKIVGYQLTLI